MPNTFETGAQFVLEDRFSPTLSKLLTGLTDADKSLKKLIESTSAFGGVFDKVTESAGKASLGMIASMSDAKIGMMKQFEGIGLAGSDVFANLTRGADAFAASTITSMSRIDTSIAASMKAMAAMGTEMERVAAATRMGGVGGHTRPGQGSAHFSRVSVPTGMGHMSFGGNGMLAAAGLVGYAAYEAAEVDDVIARAMITGQLPVGQGYMQSDAAQKMRGVIQSSMASTGFSAHDVGEALLGTERQFGGLPFNDRMDLLGKLMPYAGSEAKLKETDLKESFQSMVGLMHMTGTFDQKQLPDMARAFSFASLITPQSLSQFERTLGYSMPVLHAGMDMDPASIMFMTAMEQTAGISSTKAGTWTRDLFKNSMPFIGDDKDLDKKQIEHNANLYRLGLIDQDKGITWQKRGADGKVDWMQSIIAMSGELQSHLPQIDPIERMRVLSGALGERGAGAGALMNLPQFVEQLPVLADRMKSFTGGDDALSMLSNSTAQKARQTWQDTMIVLQDLGEKVLPTVNTALQGLDTILKKLPDDWNASVKMWSDFINHPFGSGPNNAPQSREEINRQMQNGGLRKNTAWDGLIGGDTTSAVRDGFLQAFAQIKGIDVGGMMGAAGSSGLINAAFITGTGSTGSASGGSSGSSSGGNTPGFAGRGDPVSIAERMLGANGAQAASILGTRMTPGEWCADFVNGVIKGAGGQGVNSSMARAFSTWGSAVALENARRGDVILEQHGNHIGHVGLFTGQFQRDAAGHITALGMVSGNYGGGVRENWERIGKIGGLRHGGSGPTVGAPPARAGSDKPTVVHVILDRKILATAVVGDLARGGRFPTSMGAPDTHSHYTSPGTPITDAA